MTYKETIDFLYSQLPVYHRIGKAAYKANLDNTQDLDKYSGHPHTKFRSVHVAGTNGKGSVSHMLASVLQEAGYKTGLYTSPHLRDYRERIRINGNLIPEERVVSFVGKNINFISELRPSFFEMSVALAFDYFAAERVDIAVIETGLGGRLDSTNIIIPLLSVITNIGYDHMDLLGNTLREIASEKAGIIKKKVPVLIGESHQETSSVFCEKASELSSEIFFAEKMFHCSLEDLDFSEGSRKFRLTRSYTGKTITGSASLTGDYQAKNIAVVAAAIELIKKTFNISEQNFGDGISNVVQNTGLMGRWQILDRNPLTICDTGHNKHGLECVMKQIKRTPKNNLHMVVGFVNDKDLSLILPLFPEDAIYYFTKASVPRAMDEERLREKASEYGLIGKSFTSVKMALKAARQSAGNSDMIFIGGSTFIVAEVL